MKMQETALSTQEAPDMDYLHPVGLNKLSDLIDYQYERSPTQSYL